MTDSGLPEGYPIDCSDEQIAKTVRWASSHVQDRLGTSQAERMVPVIQIGLIERQNRLTRAQLKAMEAVTRALDAQRASADRLVAGSLGTPSPSVP